MEQDHRQALGTESFGPISPWEFKAITLRSSKPEDMMMMLKLFVAISSEETYVVLAETRKSALMILHNFFAHDLVKALLAGDGAAVMNEYSLDDLIQDDGPAEVLHICHSFSSETVYTAVTNSGYPNKRFLSGLALDDPEKVLYRPIEISGADLVMAMNSRSTHIPLFRKRVRRPSCQP